MTFENLYLSNNLPFAYDKFYHQNDLNVAFIIYLGLFFKVQQNEKLLFNEINLDFEKKIVLLLLVAPSIINLDL